MATQIVMPKLGATMEEGTIVKWLIEVGEEIDEGDPIAEVLTDKITLEIEAPEDGILLKTLYEEGDVVKVQETIAYIGEEGEVINEEDSSIETISEESFKDPVVENDKQYGQAQSETGIQCKVRRTPAARKLATEHGISLQQVTGTGPKGRVKKNDVQKFLEILDEKRKITPLAAKTADLNNVDVKTISGTGVNEKIIQADVLHVMDPPGSETKEKRVPFTGMRKVIAERLSASAYTAPHVTITSEVDMTEIVKMRKILLPTIDAQVGLRVSYNEILIKAVSSTLKSHKNINISLQGNEIVYHSCINLGFAVALPDGLVVPVIKDAANKGLAQITVESKDLTEKAKSGKLMGEHMSGGTFTISNLGMYAVDSFNPIINQPESAILGVGRIIEKPVSINGEIKLRSMMTLSLSFDHRIIDGLPAAAFITDLKDVLENPIKLII